MFILMPVIFVLGILAIALEDKIKINKAAIALFMAISLWMILMFDAYDIFVERSSPLFQEFLTQNPEMANAPLKDQFITFIYYKPFDCLSFRECIRNAFLCYVLHADCRYRG